MCIIIRYAELTDIIKEFLSKHEKKKDFDTGSGC